MTDTSPEAAERIWVWWNEPHTARVVSGPGDPYPEHATAFVRADVHEAALAKSINDLRDEFIRMNIATDADYAKKLAEARAETAAVIEAAIYEVNAMADFSCGCDPVHCRCYRDREAYHLAAEHLSDTLKAPAHAKAALAEIKRQAAEDAVQTLRDEISTICSETAPDYETRLWRVLSALDLDFGQNDEKPIRDGKTLKSAEEIKRQAREEGRKEGLREERARAMLRRGMSAPEDQRVKALCERYGYGAVMDAASRLWAREDSLGAFFVGGCIGLRSDDEARAILDQAPEDQ